MSGRAVRPATLVALALVLALGAAGCGGGNHVTSPTTLSPQAADELALQIAVGVRGMTAQMDAAAGSVGGSGVPAAGLRPGAERAPASSAGYDTTFKSGELYFEVNRRWYDETGTELDGYGPLAVRMVWTTRVTGSYVTERDTANLAHSGSMDVRGIDGASDTLDFDGFAYDSVSSFCRSLDGSRAGWIFATSSLDYTGVRLLKDRVTNPWPLSGTARWQAAMDRLRSADRGDVESHFEATVTVTFDGTPTPEVVVAGLYRYRLDLVAGTLSRAGW